jgi:hypothetical protein
MRQARIIMLKRTGCVIIDKNQSAFWAENSRILAIVGEVAPDQRPREGPAGGLEKKEIKKKYVQSRNVCENKQNHDEVPGKIQTLTSKFRTFSAKRCEFCGKKRLGDDNLQVRMV